MLQRNARKMITDFETETDELMMKQAKCSSEIEAPSGFTVLTLKMTEDYRKLLGENTNRLEKDLRHNVFLEKTLKRVAEELYAWETETEKLKDEIKELWR